MIVSIISIILLVVLSIILLLLYKRQKRKLKKEFIEHCEILFNQELENKKQQLEEEAEEYQKRVLHRCEEWRNAQIAEREQVDRSLKERKQAVEEIIEQLVKRKEEVDKTFQESLKNEKERLEAEVNAHKLLRQTQLEQEYQNKKREKEEQYNKELNEFIQKCNESRIQKQTELDEVIAILEDFKKKQTVINEEILRRRQVEEQQEFFKISLDENSIRDIQILLSIREKLISRENLDKLIYDVYISKPVMEMVKRVLAGGAPSGIYKITRLKTGEIYIGKSTDVKKRWTEHCKTAFGVGSIAHSILHTTMKKDGIENFTFELLEEVPKDKLTEREKYWITFYDSKNYGLNERNG